MARTRCGVDALSRIRRASSRNEPSVRAMSVCPRGTRAGHAVGGEEALVRKPGSPASPRWLPTLRSQSGWPSASRSMTRVCRRCGRTAPASSTGTSGTSRQTASASRPARHPKRLVGQPFRSRWRSDTAGARPRSSGGAEQRRPSGFRLLVRGEVEVGDRFHEPVPRLGEDGIRGVLQPVHGC